jgi:hypothetical protein
MRYIICFWTLIYSGVWGQKIVKNLTHPELIPMLFEGAVLDGLSKTFYRLKPKANERETLPMDTYGITCTRLEKVFYLKNSQAIVLFLSAPMRIVNGKTELSSPINVLDYAVSGAVFKKVRTGWQLMSFKRHLLSAGNEYTMPNFQLISVGPERQGILESCSYVHQGIAMKITAIFAFSDVSQPLRRLFTYYELYDDTANGSIGNNEVINQTVHFIPHSNQPLFYDLLLRSKGVKGKIKYAREVRLPYYVKTGTYAKPPYHTHFADLDAL